MCAHAMMGYWACPIRSIALGWPWLLVCMQEEWTMPDYRTYDLTVTTLTPVHIGTGRVLLHGYDYAIHAKKTWVINQSALLDAQKDLDDPRLAERLATI